MIIQGAPLRRAAAAVLVWLALSGPVSGFAHERLTLANAPAFLTGLVTIAQGERLFEAQGLTVEMRSHPTGNEALESLEKGEADVATVAETAFVLHLYRNPELKALALIGGWDDDVRILARKDAGIHRPEDLRGKRIGTQARLSTHYFLDQFLLKHGMGMEEVTPVFSKAPALVNALVSGEVDAISMRDPFISQARELLGEQAVLFEEPGLYDKVFLLAVRPDLIPRKNKALAALLKALIQAEEAARTEPEAARELLRQAQPEAGDELDRAWPTLRLKVWLDHRFLLNLEKIAAWARRNHLVESPSIPNFSRNLHPELLRRLRPVAVNLSE